MSALIVLTAYVEDGALYVRGRDRLDAAAKNWKDGEYRVSIERAHAVRSLEQHRLYWVAYVRPLSEHTGYTPDEMHAYLKARFLPAEKRETKTLLLHNAAGEVIDQHEIDLSTTTTLNRVEFSEYLHAIEVFAASLGVEVGRLRETA